MYTHVCIVHRCNIPVVIMGETGCGKTRLIRYMCELQKHETRVNNLVMLKVSVNKIQLIYLLLLNRYMEELLQRILLLLSEKLKI